MKAKKFLSGFAVLAFSALLLGACSSDDKTKETVETTVATTEVSKAEEKEVIGGALQDGTYTLEEENYSNDYRVVFSIVVKDGKIVESKYDNVNKDGKSKTVDADYNEMMKDKAGVNPEEFIPKFNEELVAVQDPAAVEVVSGATHSFHSFQNYAQQLIQAAQAGNTDVIKINNGGKLADGTYTLEEKNYYNGYRAVFSIVVKDGKVVESNYDNVNEAGESKANDKEYNEMMKDKAGISPEEYIAQFNEAFVKQMASEDATPGSIDVVSGATHSFHTFVLYAEQLINAAENGNTDTITVDNFVEAN